MKNKLNELYKTNTQMELEEFKALNELQRIDFLIALKNMEDNKELGRDEFLNKYFNFSNNIQRYIKNVGYWDGSLKQWVKFIDKVLEYKEFYQELDEEEVLVIDEKEYEEKEKELVDVATLERIINEFTSKIKDENKENNLLLNLKKIRNLDSIKNPQSEEDEPILISSKLPPEVVEILSNFKKEYGLKKQEIITLSLLDFKEKYEHFS